MRAAAGRIPSYRPWAMLFSRLVLFAACQALFALAFALSGHADPWSESVRWWPVSAILANLINIGLLVGLTRAEGIRTTALYNWNRGTWKRDSLLFLGAFVILGPLAFLPSSFIALGLWSDVNATTPIMFHALPLWAVAPMFVLFPLSVAFSELPTYLGYVMPRLQVALGRRVTVVVMVAAVLALQHAALPLVFDWRFATWRALM